MSIAPEERHRLEDGIENVDLMRMLIADACADRNQLRLSNSNLAISVISLDGDIVIPSWDAYCEDGAIPDSVGGLGVLASEGHPALEGVVDVDRLLRRHYNGCCRCQLRCGSPSI